MQEYQSPEVGELAKALIKVQRSLQPALKDSLNPFAKNTYASLKSIIDSCREALLDNGIWLCQYTVPVENGYLGLVSKLTHAESGQWQASLLVMPLPKADPQGYGSALSYARRYSVSTIVGIVCEDDDAELATNGKEGKGLFLRNRNEQGQSFQEEYTPQEIISELPKLDGITYQSVIAQDGRTCIIAKGNTRAKKQILAGSGFQWNSARKVWWRYVDAA